MYEREGYHGHGVEHEQVHLFGSVNVMFVLRTLTQRLLKKKNRQEEIALWTGVEDNGSIHDGDGTIGHGLTMDIVKDLSICEHTCYACVGHLDPKASEHCLIGHAGLNWQP